MITKRFRFVSPGEVYVGVVMNHKRRPVKSLNDLLFDQQLAQAQSQATSPHCFTTKERHATVFCEWTPEDIGQPEFVDLTNPELVISELTDSNRENRLRL